MNSDAPDVTIVIVSYRTPVLLQACLASLGETASTASWEVLVVDNAPGDGSAEMVREQFPWVQMVEPGENLGFARACNLAVERGRGDYVMLLNPDTRVLGDPVGALVDLAERRPEHGLYGGRTLDDDGHVDPSSCWGTPSPWSMTCYGLGLSTMFSRSAWFDPESLGPWERDDVREVGVVTGCLLLTPTSVWRRLGGLDERFFVYGEDADLSIRAAAAGWRPVITPAATIVHHVGAASPRREDKLELVLRSKTTLMHKHWSRPLSFYGRAMLLLGVVVRATVSLAARAAGRRPPDDGVHGRVLRRVSSWLRPFPPPPGGA